MMFGSRLGFSGSATRPIYRCDFRFP